MRWCLLLPLAACSPAASDSAADTGGAADSGGTGDTADSADSGDTGELAFIHYMSTTSGIITPKAGNPLPCTGEAHVNAYEDGSFGGFASCFADDEAWQYAGNVQGTAVDGVVAATWTATNDVLEVVATFTGTIEGDTLTATIAGSNAEADVSATVVGTAFE
jgi:hypothetical protein